MCSALSADLRLSWAVASELGLVVMAAAMGWRNSACLPSVAGAVVHRSWEEALETLGRYDVGPFTQADHLLTLFRAGHHLRHINFYNDWPQGYNVEVDVITTLV